MEIHNEIQNVIQHTAATRDMLDPQPASVALDGSISVPATVLDRYYTTPRLGALSLDPPLSATMERKLQAHIETQGMAGYGSQQLQSALHSTSFIKDRSPVTLAYSYDRQGEHLRNASSVLTKLRGELTASDQRLSQIEPSLQKINAQLESVQAEYRQNLKEVDEREEQIRQVRKDLISEVHQAVKDSGQEFKSGRAAFVKSLAEYQTACTKMETGLQVLLDVSDELFQSYTPLVRPVHLPPGSSVTVVQGLPIPHQATSFVGIDLASQAPKSYIPVTGSMPTARSDLSRQAVGSLVGKDLAGQAVGSLGSLVGKDLAALGSSRLGTNLASTG